MVNLWNLRRTCGEFRQRQMLDRRGFLKAGMLGAGGLTLADLLRHEARGATSAPKENSVIILWMRGGPSHIETFNPNMEAPAPYRSLTGEVQTNLPGVSFGGTFPGLARHADKMAIVRSYHHRDSNHDASGPGALYSSLYHL